jgi:hypothetical protein
VTGSAKSFASRTPSTIAASRPITSIVSHSGVIPSWLSARKQAGQPVKKRDLAKNANCSCSRITQILKGDEPSLALAARLSKETGIPIDKFLRQSEAAQ